jgi:hypothetical protein
MQRRKCPKDNTAMVKIFLFIKSTL